jgi:transcriptional regulator
MGRKAQKNDSLPGSLDMLIVRTLSRRELHGYGIVQSIQQSSDNELLVEEGSLYPALQRLELNGWIEGVWGVTSNNRRARIYRITAAATTFVIGIGPRGVEAMKDSKTTVAPAARSSPAMKSRLCSMAGDPGGLGPKLTKCLRSAKARFASNSPPGAKPGVFGLAWM